MWVLFGSECDFYKDLRNVYAILELKELMAQKSSFTAEHCRRITWAILDNGCAHFGNVKTTLDFKGPDKPVFPQSFLINILCNVCYTIPVEHANFHDKWKRKVKTTLDDQGGHNSGGGSGQQRSRDHHSQVLGQASSTPQPEFWAAQRYGGAGGQGQFAQLPQGAWMPYQGGAYMGGQYQGGPSPLGGQQPTRDWRTGWHNERHPKIRTLMQSYLEWTNGQVHLAKILEAADTRQTDLPTLPKYVHSTG
jgi:hypothetical protein